MQPIRMVFEDTPAFIPMPKELQHGRTEVIVWPLEEQVTEKSVLENLANAQQDVMEKMWNTPEEEVWNHVESL